MSKSIEETALCRGLCEEPLLLEAVNIQSPDECQTLLIQETRSGLQARTNVRLAHPENQLKPSSYRRPSVRLDTLEECVANDERVERLRFSSLNLLPGLAALV
jgi:hypothetical protein